MRNFMDCRIKPLHRDFTPQHRVPATAIILHQSRAIGTPRQRITPARQCDVVWVVISIGTVAHGHPQILFISTKQR